MEIPGYYYDENKKKYFKISNGGVSSQYHNNTIQAKKRRIEYEKTQFQDAKQMRTKEISVIRQIQRWRHTSSPYDIVKVKLGLVGLNKLRYSFEMMKGLAYWKTLTDVFGDLWGKLNDVYMITVDGASMRISKIDHNEGTVVHTALFEELRILSYHQHLTNQNFMLPVPEIEVVATDGKYIVKYITLTSTDSAEFLAFIKFEIQTPRTRTDLTLNLIKFVENITDTATKESLQDVFGLSLVRVEQNTYQYTEPIIGDACKVTCAAIKDNKLIIGTSRSIIYVFAFNNSGVFLSYKKLTVRQVGPQTRKIVANDSKIYVSGTNENLVVLSSCMKTMHTIKHPDKIKDFHVRPSNHIIVIGLKSIVVYDLDHPSSIPVAVDYFNDNIINQISLFDDDYFLVNQSNREIRVVSYANYESTIIRLQDNGRRLTNFIRISNDIYILHWKLNGRNVYELYRL